jgi:hypothetical protein
MPISAVLASTSGERGVRPRYVIPHRDSLFMKERPTM